MEPQVLLTKEMRMRIIELEYLDLPKEKYIQEIERIYIEETGERLPATIKLMSSSESEELKNDRSGYDGTAIHFVSEDKAINE
ncbi:hypothetical protein H1Z61_17310 [Bacillus aquiflavi]|uniref:DUF6792 domain-containing protein n=1 Tax=Bacillus aquiflavi TaxID=2672567 RepID=A0A6B3W624_9BACI|nr:DUF6792 domain-containing protein [Bacillus aquiflavi]MBA4538832.1 hypothetical protein [Bacillus aquiflavi]NEY83191.1 hypothetical protein [Bacillus aquiflavi]UAC48542.1 hypothetical protein K6959_00615 [Bacillus aquiflavi]